MRKMLLSWFFLSAMIVSSTALAMEQVCEGVPSSKQQAKYGCANIFGTLYAYMPSADTVKKVAVCVLVASMVVTPFLGIPCGLAMAEGKQIDPGKDLNLIDENGIGFAAYCAVHKTGNERHPSSRGAIENFSSQSSFSTCDSENQRGFLIVETRGGLGNRLGAIATAYNLALASNRCLVIDWKAYLENELDDAEMPSLFKDLFVSTLLTVEGLEEANFISTPEREQLKEIQSYDQRTFGDFLFASESNGKDHVVFPWSRVGDYNYLNSVIKATQKYVTIRLVRDVYNAYETQSDPSDYFRLFKNLILFKPETLLKINRFKEAHFQRNEDDVLVGVHLRTMSAAAGDKKNQEIHNSHDFGTEEHFQLLVQRMQVVKEVESACGRKVSFFVATDDRSYLGRLVETFSNEEIISYPHVEISRAGLDGQLGGVIDFALLGATDYIVGRRQSTFSDIAAISTQNVFKISVGAEWLKSPNEIMSRSFVSEYTKSRAAKDRGFADYIERLSAKTLVEKKHDSRRPQVSSVSMTILLPVFGAILVVVSARIIIAWKFDLCGR